MEPALYFRILSIALGALMVLRWPFFALMERRRKLAGEGPPPAHAPLVPWLTCVVALVVVAATWWMQVRHPADYSLAVTVVATVGLAWTSQVLFNYPRLLEVRSRLLALRPGFVTAFRLTIALVGVALILLGVFVYQ